METQSFLQWFELLYKSLNFLSSDKSLYFLSSEFLPTNILLRFLPSNRPLYFPRSRQKFCLVAKFQYLLPNGQSICPITKSWIFRPVDNVSACYQTLHFLPHFFFLKILFNFNFKMFLKFKIFKKNWKNFQIPFQTFQRGISEINQ